MTALREVGTEFDITLDDAVARYVVTAHVPVGLSARGPTLLAEEVRMIALTPVTPTKIDNNAPHAAIQLIQGWLDDDSGYDEHVWPVLRRLIEEEHEEDGELCDICQSPSAGRHDCPNAQEAGEDDYVRCNCCPACTRKCMDGI